MRFIIGLSAISVFLTFGCAITTSNNAGKEKYLDASRGVGCKKQLFREKPTVKYDFNSKQELKKFTIVNGTWEIDNGELSAVAGENNRTILLTKSMKGPLRIELEVTNYANPDGSIGDITILLNAKNSKDFFRNGYALTTGSYYNSCTTFYRLGKAIAKTEYSPLVSGKTYKVVIELVNGHIRYWLNDEIILEAWDAEQLKMNPERWMGIRTWNTKMSTNWFAVYQLQ